MSTADFQKVLVKDDRLCVTDSIKYAVMKGGQSVTSAQFAAISEGNSSHSYNVQVPSQETLIDRRLVWNSTAKIAISLYNNTGNAQTAGNMIGYGGSGAPMTCTAGTAQSVSALSAFPLHQMCTVMTSTINNTSVSINIRDVLPLILRMNDKRELSKYNSITPCAFDTYQNYNDAIGSINNPLGAWGNSADNDISQRGSWVCNFFAQDGVTPLVASAAIANATALNFVVQFTSSEPLLLSPWMFCDPKYNNQAMYGVQNLNFVFNIGDYKRVWRTNIVTYSNAGAVPANSVGMIGVPLPFTQGFSNSRLLFNFLTPHPSDLLPARNICPYYEMPRYLTGSLPSLLVDQSATFTSQTLQLNQIPDKLICCVRKRMSDQNNNNADCFLPINGINIQFNNNAGILSSATPYDLFDMGSKAGNNQTWYEWSGKANSASASTQFVPVRTSGSILVLEFGRDIQIPEDFYSAGSLGNFSIQVQLNVTNNSGANINSAGLDQYEICMVTMNSGVFVCERGTSQVFTGILTKQDVLDASAQDHYSRSDVQRLVGGGFFDSLKSVAGKIGSVIAPVAKVLAPIAKSVLASSGDPRAMLAAQGLGALGYGKKKIDQRLM